MTTNKLAFPTPEQDESGKGGESGDFQVTNAAFVTDVFLQLPEGGFAAVCSKPGDPGIGGWVARRADAAVPRLSVEHNNYINCSSFYPGKDGSFKARKAQFAACHFLMLDDLGTKVPFDRLAGFELSWQIETSPGNHQGGIILAEPITDGDVAVRLLTAMINAGLCDPGATGPLSRWARLPFAINGKAKYVDEAGTPFRCRLVEWRPDKRQTINDNPVILLDQRRGTVHANHGWDIEATRHNRSMRILPALIGDKSGKRAIAKLQHVGR